VHADYATTTEIADALLQKADVPFRTGHHFASKLTDYGRGKGLKLQEIPFAEVQRIYEEQAKTKLPLSAKEFREVLSAETMVFGRKGLGGPQVAEVSRMLKVAGASVSASLSAQKRHPESLTDKGAGEPPKRVFNTGRLASGSHSCCTVTLVSVGIEKVPIGASAGLKQIAAKISHECSRNRSSPIRTGPSALRRG